MNTYNLSRLAIVFIWLYHGIVPKLIFAHATELELAGQGPTLGSPEATIFVAGIVEVIAGLVVAIWWRARWPIHLSLFGFILLLLGAIVLSPEHATHAFNPITTTGAAIIFCLIQLVESRGTKDFSSHPTNG